jgi:LacI family transcriptional regulator, galactose operon repressor
MQEVAKRAGVAPSSVSRVLSGHPNVSEVMRNRVVDAVSALGYEPDLLAQSLRRGASMTVGFVVGNISNPLLSEIALGAETRLQAAGYSMLLVNSMNEPELDAGHIRLFAQRRVDGMLLSLSSEDWPGTIEAVNKAGLPVVLVDRELDVAGRVSSVLAEHDVGIAAAVRHLASLGHRRIALVNGPPNLRPARDRASTMRRVSRQLGIACSVRSGGFNAEHGDEATLGLLSQSDPPTALVAGSNQLLVGVLRALHRMERQIPDDVSLVTCDAVPLAEFLVPPLATITRDHHAMGAIAASLLLELLSGARPRIERVPTTYNPTASVGVIAPLA